VLLFTTVDASLEAAAMRQVRAAVARRQRFAPGDERAIRMFGRQEFRPVVEGISMGLQALLVFIGTLTLAIGGVGLMNIMLVSVDERVREIGIRRALGARRSHILSQVFAETLAITIAGGLLGMALSYGLSAAVGTLPLLGPLYEDTSGKGDITLSISWATAAISASLLLLVGLLSGSLPAFRASRLDPADALRYE
jgi:putative ABC transport system permease protein